MLSPVQKRFVNEIDLDRLTQLVAESAETPALSYQAFFVLGLIEEETGNQEAAYQAQRDVEEKRQVVVGVNRFADAQSASVPVFYPNEAVARSLRRRASAAAGSRGGCPSRRCGTTSANRSTKRSAPTAGKNGSAWGRRSSTS